MGLFLILGSTKKYINIIWKLSKQVHSINIPIIKYNNENSPVCVIKIVYINVMTKYIIVQDAGKLVFVNFSFHPNNKNKFYFIIELKSLDLNEALKQIKKICFSLKKSYITQACY